MAVGSLQIWTWLVVPYSIAVAAVVPVAVTAASAAPPMPLSSAALAVAPMSILLIRLTKSSSYVGPPIAGRGSLSPCFTYQGVPSQDHQQGADTLSFSWPTPAGMPANRTDPRRSEAREACPEQPRR